MLDISCHISGGAPCVGNLPALAIGLHAGNTCTPMVPGHVHWHL